MRTRSGRTPNTRLREAREDAGLSLTQMAERIGIGLSRYYMIETGQRPATEEIASAAAAILGVPVDDLFVPTSFTVREVEAAHAPSP